MTPQEAIETIKVAIAEVEWDYPMDYLGAFEDAIKALEKQMPRNPVVSDDGWQISCPNCSATLIYCLHTSKIDCCDKCGQRLDWEGIE